MTNEESNLKNVPIGLKDISRYISACLYSLSKENEVKILARGNNTKKAIDILAILIRDYLDKPQYNVVVDSEKFKEGDHTRYVSTIEITLSGVRKEIK